MGLCRRFLILACLLLVLPAAGRQYTTDNQLLSNTVYCIFRDSKGFLWLGTDAGVMRFNGREFRPFTVQDGLSDQEIFNFYEDPRGRIWLFTYNGTPCFIRDDSVFNISNCPELRHIPQIAYINTMFFADDSTAYIGYKDGELLRVVRDRVDTLLGKRQPKAEQVDAIYAVGRHIRVVSTGRTYTFSGKTLVSVSPERERTAYGGKHQRLYVAGAADLSVYRDSSLLARYTHPQLNRHFLLHVSENTQGDLLCASTEGVYRVHRSGQITDLLPGIKASSVCQDIFGNYWISTLGKGVYCFNEAYDQVKSLSTGHYEQLRFNQQDLVFLHSGRHIKVLGTTGQPVPDLSLAGQHVEPLFADSSLCVFRTNTWFAWRQFRNRPRESLTIYPYYLKKVMDCGNQELLLLLHARGKACIRRVGYARGQFRISDSLVFNERLIATRYHPVQRRLYLLTLNRCYSYDLDSRKLQLIDSFGQAATLDIFFIGHYIVIPANDKSVFLYDAANTALRRKTWLPYAIYDAFTLPDGRSLIRSDKGYMVAAPGLQTEGLPVFEQVAYPFDRNEIDALYPVGDSLLCRNANGLSLFPAALLNSRKHKPNCRISTLRINGRAYPAAGRLPYSSRYRLQVTADAFFAAHTGYYYQYRLCHGTDTGGWQNSPAGDIDLRLTHPGSYSLLVRTRSADGTVSDTVPVLFKLPSPFYSSWWFLSLLGLLLVFTCWYLVRRYKARKRTAAARERLQLEQEGRSVHAIMNPHFIFNAINNIQHLVNEQNGEKANEYLYLLSRLIRQNMEHLQLNLVSLDKELALVNAYISLQNLRFNNRIAYVLEWLPPDERQIMIPPLLIHTFVENAVIHGFSTTLDDFRILVQVSLSTDDYLVIRISDNGLGYDPEGKVYRQIRDKTSVGIENIRKRLEGLSLYCHRHYTIEIGKGENGKGTEVTLLAYSGFAAMIA